VNANAVTLGLPPVQSYGDDRMLFHDRPQRYTQPGKATAPGTINGNAAAS